ncbi:unnamed protein product [Diamesa serratosioi]
MKLLIILIVCIVLINEINAVVDHESLETEEQCSSISCVHASASILERLDLDIDPCDDFYGYACGNFAEEIHTPDEKSTVDTLTLMNDKLNEYLLTVLTKPILDSERKTHKLSKIMFKSCENVEKINNRGKSPLLDILENIQGLPMLNGNKWNESEWDWEQSLLNLRQKISKQTNNIFENQKNNDAKSEIKVTHFIYFNKNKFFIRSKKFKKVPGFLKVHKKIFWLELLSPSYLANNRVINETLGDGFIQSYYDFINQTSKRVLANYVGWRLIQTSLDFTDKTIRGAVLTFQKSALGKEDLDQRWKFCANLVTNEAAVATGSLYVDEYFTEDDKKSAVKLVDNLLKEYIATIESSDWMDDQTKEAAKNTTVTMKRYIGYNDKLRTEEANEYYNDLFEHPEENFLEMGLAFKIFETDREFKRINEKKGADWTKYSRPATINAFYNSRDNSIQFPAAILQSPNFDKDRPNVMNFGAIGSIIGHEITHAFDNLAVKKQGWSKESTDDYERKVNCVIDQYNNYHVAEVEDAFGINFTIDGNFTIKENIADCGGIKLAYNAYKKSLQESSSQSLPIGLNELTNDQIFWVSFAQTFCSVERPARMKNKRETDVHALDRFRVIGPTSNMKMFATDFNCPVGSPMNPAKRCAVF